MMNTLLTLRDAHLATGFAEPTKWRERTAARAVVRDTDGAVALLYARVHNYHKLPGGGIEDDEDTATALARECIEEIGCDIQNVAELGTIVEWRNSCDVANTGLHQTSHCYTADIRGTKGTPQLTQTELDEGFETVWLPLVDAIAQLEKEQTDRDHYEAKFMTRRDLTFLRAARDIDNRV
jgi:8-oxo-dGTP diphosphatase